MCVETAEYFKQGLSLSGCNFQTLTLVKELWGLQQMGDPNPPAVCRETGSGHGTRW